MNPVRLPENPAMTAESPVGPTSLLYGAERRRPSGCKVLYDMLVDPAAALGAEAGAQ